MSVGRNSIYNIAGSVTPLILALVTIPLYLQAVGPERYGALAIAWLILGYFGLFDLGLGRATAQRIAALHDSSQNHRARVFWTAIVVNVAMGLVGAVLLFFGARYFFLHHFEADPWLIAEVTEALPYLAIGVPVATLTGVASGALQGREKFLDVNIVNVAGTSLFQLLPLLVAYLHGPELKWLIVAAVIARLIGLFLTYLRVQVHLLQGQRPGFDRNEWIALLKFGGWVSLTTLIGPLIIIADRLMIGALIGAVAVAVYAVAFDISRRLSLIPNAIGQAVFPRIAKAGDDERRSIMIRSLGVLDMFLTAPVIAALFLLGPFLELWVGVEIGSQATSVGQILLIAYWANAFAIIPFVRLQAQGRPDIVAIIVAIQAPIHLVILYLGLSMVGLLGAAIAVTIRSIVEVFVMLYFANRGILIPKSFPANFAWLVISCLLANSYDPLSVQALVAMPLLLIASFTTSWCLSPEVSRKIFFETLRRGRSTLTDKFKKG